MSSFDEFAFSAEEFSGTARLFPLPNLVLFPHVMQPLHVFEPRYRAMLEEALRGDRMITMGVLVPGWENDYDGRPPVWPMGCLGRVAVSQRQKGGSYNVLLVALRRVRLVEELPPAKSFREATAEICEDCYPADRSNTTPALSRQLRDAFRSALPSVNHAKDQVDQLLSSDLPLGTLTDIISYMLDIQLDAKVALLSEADVHRRARLLLDHLAETTVASEPAAAGAAGFPPHFSVN